MLDDLHALKTRMEDEGAIFCFSGPISHQIVIGIGEALKNNMQADRIDTSTSMKIFSIFMEQMQNMMFYSAERLCGPNGEGEFGFGIIVLGRREGEHFVLCGNRIPAAKVERLRGYLSDLVAMSPDQLKQLYRQKRKQGPEADSKGAGLGFIEMARKCSRPLEFDFKPIDADTAFFTIRGFIQ